MLDCYSGKILCAGGLLMLGIPRDDIQTRNQDQECMAMPSTDQTSGPGFSSDCTDEEIPDGWCFWGSSCSEYGDLGQHPKHPGPGKPWEPESGENWALYFDGPSPGENFLKIYDDDDTWYYVTVVPPLPYPFAGGGTPGTNADKAGRYTIMNYVLQANGPQHWFRSTNGVITIVEPADQLP